MPRARPAARDDSPGLGCSRGGRKWGMDVTPDVTPGSRLRPAPGGTLCHREPPHPVRPGDPVGCGIKPPPGVTGQTGSAAPSPLSCKDKAARRGHSGAAGMGMGTAGVQLGVCVFGGGGKRVLPQSTGPKGSGDGGQGRTAKEAAAQRQICFMVLSSRRRAAMQPSPPAWATASRGASGWAPRSPARSRTAARAGARSCRSGSQGTPPLRPSVPPSFPPSLPPQRSQHPRIPASELVPRSHTLTGPSWTGKVGGGGTGGGQFSHPVPKGRQGCTPKKRGEHPPAALILLPKDVGPSPCPGGGHSLYLPALGPRGEGRTPLSAP